MFPSTSSFYRITPNITATPQLSSPSPQLSEDDIKNSASSSGHLPYAKQYELGDEPQRKKFLDTFKDFMEQNGTPCLRVPMADNTNNIPLDLYKLYREVCRRNGMPEVRITPVTCDIVPSIFYNLNNNTTATPKKKYRLQDIYPHDTKLTKPSVLCLKLPLYALSR